MKIKFWEENYCCKKMYSKIYSKIVIYSNIGGGAYSAPPKSPSCKVHITR